MAGSWHEERQKFLRPFVTCIAHSPIVLHWVFCPPMPRVPELPTSRARYPQADPFLSSWRRPETRWQTPSHHRHGSQARADCLPSAEHEGSLQRECLSPLRRRSLKARSISTPETSRTTGISTHPSTERMMFLGSRLVGSDLRACIDSGRITGHSEVMPLSIKARRTLRITVGNRDSHQLSQNAITGAKRISQHLFAARWGNVLLGGRNVA